MQIHTQLLATTFTATLVAGAPWVVPGASFSPRHELSVSVGTPILSVTIPPTKMPVSTGFIQSRTASMYQNKTGACHGLKTHYCHNITATPLPAPTSSNSMSPITITATDFTTPPTTLATSTSSKNSNFTLNALPAVINPEINSTTSTPKPEANPEKKLNTQSYLFLVFVGLVIFGGLIWIGKCLKDTWVFRDEKKMKQSPLKNLELVDRENTRRSLDLPAERRGPRGNSRAGSRRGSGSREAGSMVKVGFASGKRGKEARR
ncbi:hypothetical protein B0J14DRAFT_650637 [Halenospora varia]|nr:hypothetical protein B0J14DRAFT_650637 [Halenospora varia]